MKNKNKQYLGAQGGLSSIILNKKKHIKWRVPGGCRGCYCHYVCYGSGRVTAAVRRRGGVVVVSAVPVRYE